MSNKSWSEQVSDPGTSGRGHVLEPKIKFVKGGGYIVEPVVPIGAIMQAITVTCHEGLITQAWYHETELDVEQHPEHQKTMVHLTEIIDLEFSYLPDDRIQVDGYMRITDAYLDKQRKFHERRRWLKRVNPTLYRMWTKNVDKKANGRQQGRKA